MSEEFVVDLTNYRDKVGQRVTPGRYRVLVDFAEMDKSKNNNEMVNLWFRVVGGEFDGAQIVDRLVLTENSLFRVVGFMQAIGLPTPKKRLMLNLRQFIGKALDVDVEDGDPYNGRVKSEVRGYMAIPKSEQADLPLDLPEGDSEGLGEFAPETSFNPGEEPVTVPATVDETVDLDAVDLG